MFSMDNTKVCQMEVQKRILITGLTVPPDVTDVPENLISKKLSKEIVAMDSLFAMDDHSDDNVGDRSLYNALLTHGKNVTTTATTNSKKRKGSSSSKSLW